MSVDVIQPFSVYLPTRLFFGAGCFQRAGQVASSLGDRALLVTCRSAMDSLGFAEQIEDDLKQHGMVVRRHRGAHASPTLVDVEQGAARARDHRANVVVALGGGAVLDLAKVIAGLAPSAFSAFDLLYQRAEVGRDALPSVCIPTTAGTGSEMNRSAMVTDSARPFKDGIRSDFLFPRFALVDPQLTWSVPKTVTAQTGFDVLTHAVESYVSPKSTPTTDALARHAMQLVCRYLPRVLQEPHDPEAREWLAYASTTMGINLACVGTCFPHRADKSLCALRPEIPHGQSVALFYPYWVRSCYCGAVDRFSEIATLLDRHFVTEETPRAAEHCARAMADFIRQVGLQLGLKRFVQQRELAQLVVGVAGDLTINPVPLRRDELSRVFAEIYQEDDA